MYITYTTKHTNIVAAFGCVEFSFLFMFEVVQDPARCCMLLHYIVVYCNTAGAAPANRAVRSTNQIPTCLIQ